MTLVLIRFTDLVFLVHCCCRCLSFLLFLSGTIARVSEQNICCKHERIHHYGHHLFQRCGHSIFTIYFHFAQVSWSVVFFSVLCFLFSSFLFSSNLFLPPSLSLLQCTTFDQRVPPHDEQHSVVQWAVHPQQILPFDAGRHRPRCFERWGGTTSGAGGRGRSDEKHLLPLCFALFEIGKRQHVGELPFFINENTTVCVCTHVFLFSFCTTQTTLTCSLVHLFRWCNCGRSCCKPTKSWPKRKEWGVPVCCTCQ